MGKGDSEKQLLNLGDKRGMCCGIEKGKKWFKNRQVLITITLLPACGPNFCVTL